LIENTDLKNKNVELLKKQKELLVLNDKLEKELFSYKLEYANLKKSLELPIDQEIRINLEVSRSNSETAKTYERNLELLEQKYQIQVSTLQEKLINQYAVNGQLREVCQNLTNYIARDSIAHTTPAKVDPPKNIEETKEEDIVTLLPTEINNL